MRRHGGEFSHDFISLGGAGQKSRASDRPLPLRKFCEKPIGGNILRLIEHKNVVYVGCMFQPTIGSMYYGAVPFYVLSGASFVAAAICFSLLFLL